MYLAADLSGGFVFESWYLRVLKRITALTERGSARMNGMEWASHLGIAPLPHAAGRITLPVSGILPRPVSSHATWPTSKLEFRDSLTEMDSRFRGNDVISARRVAFRLAVIPAEAGIHRLIQAF